MNPIQISVIGYLQHSDRKWIAILKSPRSNETLEYPVERYTPEWAPFEVSVDDGNESFTFWPYHGRVLHVACKCPMPYDDIAVQIERFIARYQERTKHSNRAIDISPLGYLQNVGMKWVAILKSPI